MTHACIHICIYLNCNWPTGCNTSCAGPWVAALCCLCLLAVRCLVLLIGAAQCEAALVAAAAVVGVASVAANTTLLQRKLYVHVPT